ncbi:hypothetical protein BGW36DRAFT_389379 [Talaromyces proteolyticus]|uniref:F-box domain-containing protein n=1 Tax=Talaromyces proteolyticus TaxID=1131652 RepID=A0AAD4KGU6_9EURO|nr:uncharacterized protein BGW36DRAFT_389379 [Talaromyces proteolyticus]KAH8690815.1 hypothetical protein BGW36DRAFT_389379 [Talaromyces proteolyticus]
MSEAQNTALGSPEILEQILLHLDMRSLLTSAQRVCQAWHNLTTQSPSLQKHLFFKPETSPTAVTKVANPLLQELFPHWFWSWDIKEQAKPFWKKDLENLPLASDERNAVFMNESASWRRMLTTQPPIRSFIRCETVSAQLGESSNLARVESTGINKMDLSSDNKPEENSDPEDMPEKDSLNPVRMDKFYDLITCGSGIAHHWYFLWNHDGKLSIPFSLNRQAIGDRVQKEVTRGFKEDGLVMFEFSTFQCSVGSTPWAFEDKFVFDKERRGSRSRYRSPVFREMEAKRRAEVLAL